MAQLEILKPEHPAYHVFYRIEKVTRYTGSDRSNRTSEKFPFKGITVDGRTVVILSPYALTCGWTRRSNCISSCKRIATDDAFKLGVNAVMYGLTH